MTEVMTGRRSTSKILIGPGQLIFIASADRVLLRILSRYFSTYFLTSTRDFFEVFFSRLATGTTHKTNLHAMYAPGYNNGVCVESRAPSIKLLLPSSPPPMKNLMSSATEISRNSHRARSPPPLSS